MIYKRAKSYQSSDPFKVAESLGIYVLEKDLGEVYGFYTKMNRIKFIFINEMLNEQLKTFTCAHELGHSVLHPDSMTPKLSRLALTSSLREEREANEFATHFLMDGSHAGYHIDTKQGILDYYGLPKEMERFI